MLEIDQKTCTDCECLKCLDKYEGGNSTVEVFRFKRIFSNLQLVDG